MKMIMQALDKTKVHLSLADFRVEEKQGFLVTTYLYRDNSFISFEFSSEEEEYIKSEESTQSIKILGTTTKKQFERDYKVIGVQSPGKFLTQENFEFFGESKITNKVEVWVSNLWLDITADPIIRKNLEHQKKVDEFLDAHFSNFSIDDNDKEFFTDKEVKETKEKLDLVQEKIKEQLEKTLKDQKELKAQLSELKAEFESFKQIMPNLTRSNWKKSTLTRIALWVFKKENQELIANSLEAVKMISE